MNPSTPNNFEEKALLRIAGEKTGWLDRFNETLSEWCSSILVKETRQALQSRQFVWTYFLLLAAVGLWTFVGIALGRADFEYGDMGRDLLMGLFVIMGFPLLIIIPFSAYRSLAREFEDGTIELISITTMKPSQIVIGKFTSSILQTLIYLSVLAPCVLFTYLLRGISLPQIIYGLVMCVGFSICLTILGLFLAGAIRSRALSVGVSVLFVLLLGWLYYIWSSIIEELVRSAPPGFEDRGFAFVSFGFIAFFGSTAILLLVTAASQISFESDNRSTAIRCMMLVQQVLFWAFVATLAQVEPLMREGFFILALVAGHYWLIMGFLMIGESPKRSRRVQRYLPSTFLGRSLFSFLMPGPGRGFLFALAMIWSCGIVIGLLTQFQEGLFFISDLSQLATPRLSRYGWMAFDFRTVYGGIGLSSFYVSLFLSLSYLFARWRLHSGRWEFVNGTGPAISLVIGIAMVALTTIGSLVVHFSASDYETRSDYAAVDTFNWYWSVAEFSDPGGGSVNLIWLVLLVFPSAAIIFLAVALASRELLHHPIPVPERVLVDQQKPVVALPKGESIDEIFGEL